jgi:hypothetical protein
MKERRKRKGEVLQGDIGPKRLYRRRLLRLRLMGNRG